MAIDSNTLVLLHLDGNVKDECGHTFTATNIGYANAKFGQGAITKDHTSKIACKNPGFTLGGSDFTIDFWVKSTGSAECGQIRANFGKNGFKYPELAKQYFGE